MLARLHPRTSLYYENLISAGPQYREIVQRKKLSSMLSLETVFQAAVDAESISGAAVAASTIDGLFLVQRRLFSSMSPSCGLLN